MIKIKKFTDLIAWQKAHKLVLTIYRRTKNFPIDERFNLVQQMRRCAVSITSNIAEGFARKTYKDKIRFYYMSVSSIAELQSQLLIARDLGYLDNTIFLETAHKTVTARKLINGLIRKAKTMSCDTQY